MQHRHQKPEDGRVFLQRSSLALQCVYLLNTLAPGALAAAAGCPAPRAVSVPVLTPLNTDGATLPMRSEHRGETQTRLIREERARLLILHRGINNVRAKKYLQQLYLFHPSAGLVFRGLLARQHSQ